MTERVQTSNSRISRIGRAVLAIAIGGVFAYLSWNPSSITTSNVVEPPKVTAAPAGARPVTPALEMANDHGRRQPPAQLPDDRPIMRAALTNDDDGDAGNGDTAE